MDLRFELQRLEHQLELADRALVLIRDHDTAERLEEFVAQIKDRLRRLEQERAHARIRTRAHELWEEAGCPPGRDLEFWLRAEREFRNVNRP